MLKFQLELAVKLDPAESRPWACYYLTEDQRTRQELGYLDTCQRRILSRITGRPVPDIGNGDWGILHLKDVDTVVSDTSVCFQLYCDYRPEGHTYIVSHACGWCSVSWDELRTGVQKGATSFRLVVNDASQGGGGNRGCLVVHLDASSVTLIKTHDAKSSSSRWTHAMGKGDDVINVAMTYELAVKEMYAHKAVVSSRIKMVRPPFYLSCGNGVCCSPIAFIMDRRPVVSESFIMALLLHALLEKYPSVQDRLGVFLSDRPSRNEQGAILGRVATMLSTACTYVQDTVLEGGRLAFGEDFCRNSLDTMSGDCEDFTHNAVIILDAILLGTFTTPAVKLLQRIRSRYIIGASYKMASVGAQSQARGDAPKQNIVAHESCDMIPIDMLIRATPQQTILNSIREHRKKLGMYDDRADTLDLGIIMCEGTSHTTQYHRPDEAGSASKDTLLRACTLLESVPLEVDPLDNEDAPESQFYRYSVSMQLSDTLLHTRMLRREAASDTVAWELPEVVFMTEGQIGVKHAEYMAGKFDVWGMPALSLECESANMYLEKFRPELYFPASPNGQLDATIDGHKALITQKLTSVVRPGSGKQCVFYVSFEQLTPPALTKLVDILSSNSQFRLASFQFQHITMAVSFVLLFLRPI